MAWKATRAQRCLKQVSHSYFSYCEREFCKGGTDAQGLSSFPSPRSTGSSRVGMSYRRWWLWLIMVGAVVVIASGAVVVLRGKDDPVIVTAGDIACSTRTTGYNGGEGTATACRQSYTSELILHADAVLTLGDHQYANGTLSEFNTVYDATWGRMKTVTYPTPGDHDYANSGGSGRGYFTYFDVEPYYSFDIGSWHLVSLNYELDHTADSVQVQWLKKDLAATSRPCIGAYWGVPMFTSGSKGNDYSYKPFWDALYAAGADVVLA